MSALFTALLESESKEKLALMVCELREEVARLREENEKLRLSERVYSDSCPTEEIP